MRKNVKDNEDKAGGADDLGGVGDDAAFGAGPAPAGGINPADAAAKGLNKHKKAKVKLPWDVSTFFNVVLPEREDDEGDEEEEEMNIATLQRLKNADERTKGMTRDEYVHWSECRQASFTFRKGKRFREWAGFGIVTDGKPNDDIVDILGFLTFEIVQTLTEEALRVKAAEDAQVKISGGGGGGGGSAAKKADKADGEDGLVAEGRKRKRELGLFEPPEEERTPVQPKHVQEAFRRLQAPSKKLKAMSNFTRTLPGRRPLKLVCLAWVVSSWRCIADISNRFEISRLMARSNDFAGDCDLGNGRVEGYLALVLELDVATIPLLEPVVIFYLSILIDRSTDGHPGFHSPWWIESQSSLKVNASPVASDCTSGGSTPCPTLGPLLLLLTVEQILDHLR